MAMDIKQMHIDRTETSPEVQLDLETGTIDFIGRSLPANGELFYERVFRWLEEYLENPREETVVNMRMDYLDTSSSKHFYNIFDKLRAANGQATDVHINWHFETGDQEMAETGKDYQALFPLDFRFIEVRDLF